MMESPPSSSAASSFPVVRGVEAVQNRLRSPWKRDRCHWPRPICKYGASGWLAGDAGPARQAVPQPTSRQKFARYRLSLSRVHFDQLHGVPDLEGRKMASEGAGSPWPTSLVSVRPLGSRRSRFASALSRAVIVGPRPPCDAKRVSWLHRQPEPRVDLRLGV